MHSIFYSYITQNCRYKIFRIFVYLVSKRCLLNVFTDVIKTWSQEESGLVAEVGRDDLCDHGKLLWLLKPKETARYVNRCSTNRTLLYCDVSARIYGSADMFMLLQDCMTKKNFFLGRLLKFKFDFGI